MLVLWGRPTSSNVKKVLWTLEEIGLDYQFVKAGGPYGGLDTPEFLALNPNGLVPTIKDDELVLWESNTIVRYLAARYGKGSRIVANARLPKNGWIGRWLHCLARLSIS